MEPKNPRDNKGEKEAYVEPNYKAPLLPYLGTSLPHTVSEYNTVGIDAGTEQLPEGISDVERVIELTNSEQTLVRKEELQALASEINTLCDEFIALGRRTEGDLFDENGPFSRLEQRIKDKAEQYVRKIIKEYGKNFKLLPPQLRALYITKFFNKTAFPYISVVAVDITDESDESQNPVTIELDEQAIIDAIDAE